MTTFFEAVPNFSEGRDAATIASIADEARSVPGVTVLDVESNADHNRCVVSLVGEAVPLSEALFRMIRRAIAVIDLTRHRGEHPRMGAADVVPFVPLGEATMEEAVALAERLGERVARELELPVYLYAAAAHRPERRDLAHVRRGEFEGIRDSIASDPARAPDFGPPRVHPTAGVVAIGARPVLIAYNAYLSTPDVAVAKKIAHSVRARDGGLAEVKALGFEIKERDRAQVSMNLTDYRKTPVHRALEAVRREAKRYGASVEESEIGGLVPEDALFDAAEYYLQLNRFDRATILERKVRATVGGAVAAAPASLAASSVEGFTARLAARTPTPGGGSAAAAAAAFGAALGAMVVAYSQPAQAPDAELAELARFLEEARASLLRGVDRDSEAYEKVREARRALKAAPADEPARARYTAALRGAIEVPLETARTAHEVGRRLGAVRGRLKAALESDLITALALLGAGSTGALANATINLPDLGKAGVETSEYQHEIDRIRSSRD